MKNENINESKNENIYESKSKNIYKIKNENINESKNQNIYVGKNGNRCRNINENKNKNQNGNADKNKNRCGNKNEIRLYNMILPPFMLFAFIPSLVLASLVGNFIIDSLVLIAIIFIVYKKFNGKVYIKTIFKLWGLGFAADFVGQFYLMGMSVMFSSKNADGLLGEILNGIYVATNQSHFDSVWGVAFIASGIFVAAALIFFFDYFVFKKFGFTKRQCIFSAFAFAVITAPYTLLLPKELFY